MTAAITFEVDGMALHLPDATGLAPLSLPAVAETAAAPSQDAVDRFQAAMQDAPQPGDAIADSASRTAVLLAQLTSPDSLEHAARAQEEPVPAEAATGIASQPPATAETPPETQAQPAAAEALAVSQDSMAADTVKEAPATPAHAAVAVPEKEQPFEPPVVQTPVAAESTPIVATETPAATESTPVVTTGTHLATEPAPEETPRQPETAAVPPAVPRESMQQNNPTPHTADVSAEHAIPSAMNAIPAAGQPVGQAPVVDVKVQPSETTVTPPATEQPVGQALVVDVKVQPPQTMVTPPATELPVAQELVVVSEAVGESRPVVEAKAPTPSPSLKNLERTEEDSGDAEQPPVASAAAASVQTPAATVQAAPVPVAMPALDGVASAPTAVSGAGMTSAQIEELVESVAAQIRVEPSLRSGEGTVMIQLKPTVLEGSRISLSAKDGALSVEITPAVASEVAARIQNALPRLEAALAGSIAEFHSISVSLRKDRKDETA